MIPKGQTNPAEDALSVSQSGTTSPEGKDTSKSGKKVTISLEEFNNLKSDALMEKGRVKKLEAEKQEQTNQISSLTKRLSSLEEDSHKRAYDQARNEGEPALTLFQRNEELAKRERQFAEKETEINRRELQVEENETSFNARKAQLVVPIIAAKYGLKPEDLADFNITEEVTLDKIAQRISGKKPEAEEAETVEEGQKPFEPISFQSSGAAVKKKIETVEDVRKASIDEITETFFKPSK